MHGTCIEINQSYSLGFLHSLARFVNTPIAEEWHKAEREGIYRVGQNTLRTFSREL